MALRFEWDEEKAEANLRKHGVSFDEARTVFGDVLSSSVMKKASDKSPEATVNGMRPEYDFSGGVRGKYASEYHRGHTVTIHRTDGSTVVERHGPPEDAIVLDPDVKPYFPDSEAVNEALRGLIRLAPSGPRDR